LPSDSQTVLDAHPVIRAQLGDPLIPLWMTEGVFKADAAISAGLCCIALLGVWNFRGLNRDGGKTALADWEYIALNNRAVYLVFDSDAMVKAQVHKALARLGAFLTSRGAHVHYVYLPAGPGGTKVGLDDLLAAGRGVDDLLALASPELRPPAGADDEETGPYVATPDGIVYRRPTRDGPVDQLLSNFCAQITEEVLADDGVSERSELVIEGELIGGIPLPRITVPLSRFGALDWPVQKWGTRAIVSAGLGTKDRLREAMQRLSPDVPRRRVFEHSGWRALPDLGWCFLHAGGAIGANGSIAGIEVALRGAAGHIRLPEPPTGDELRDAVRASLALLDLGPDRITVPLLAAVYRAILCDLVPADLSVFLVGPSGVYKSELAALAMQHVGAGFDRLHLPAQWSATGNFLERIVFEFKDVPVAIDDFAPTGSQAEIARMHATADRVLRGVGNRGGRGRMNADGSLRPDYPPRGVVIATGEDAPRGHSLRARLMIVEVGPGDVDRDRLSLAQAAGRNGVFVAGLAGFVQWLAGQMEELRPQVLDQLVDFRARVQHDESHARTPDAVAHLALAWKVFLRFAVEAEALSQQGAEELFGRMWEALTEAASSQGQHQGSEEPARRFIELLGSALAGGYAHVAAPSGFAPLIPEAWGWRDGEHLGRQPQGTRIGWLDDDDLYLDLEAALTAAQRVGQATGSPIGVTPKTLAKRLHERGFLQSTELTYGELQVRRTLEGRRRRVVHLTASAITLEETGQTGQTGQTGPAESDSASRRGVPSVNGRIVWPDSEREEQQSGQEIRPQHADPRGNGRVGRNGRVLGGGEEDPAAEAPDRPRSEVDDAVEVVEWRG
jgi:hypothetical protein